VAVRSPGSGTTKVLYTMLTRRSLVLVVALIPAPVPNGVSAIIAQPELQDKVCARPHGLHPRQGHLRCQRDERDVPVFSTSARPGGAGR
jgi:hypothetical protein